MAMPRPRTQSPTGSRILPAGWTSRTASAPSPQPTTSRSPADNTLPGSPRSWVGTAPNSLRGASSWVVHAPGLGEPPAEALGSVQAVFGDAVTEQLAAAYVQDWQADPYSRGGYSFVRVSGHGGRERLAEPVGDTLFFAGEATDKEEAGTVAGMVSR